MYLIKTVIFLLLTIVGSYASADVESILDESCIFLFLPKIDGQLLDNPSVSRDQKLTCMDSIKDLQENLDFDEMGKNPKVAEDLLAIRQFLLNWTPQDWSSPSENGEGWISNGFGNRLPQSRLGRVSQELQWDHAGSDELVFD